MNYVLQNLKLVAAALGISLLPAIYYANKAPAMKDCQTEYTKQKNKEIDEFQAQIRTDDGKRF